MTRFRHDRFAKSFLADLLEPLGQVEVSREITDEPREIDLYFTPTPTPGLDPGSPPGLGVKYRSISRGSSAISRLTST